MPRYQEEERIYHKGFRDGWRAAMSEDLTGTPIRRGEYERVGAHRFRTEERGRHQAAKKRKLSGWNKFVKVNSKKKQFRYANGKVNLKKLGVAWRKKKRGR